MFGDFLFILLTAVLLSITLYLIQSLKFIQVIDHSPRVNTRKFMEKMMYVSFSVTAASAMALLKGVLSESILVDESIPQISIWTALTILGTVFIIAGVAFAKRGHFRRRKDARMVLPFTLIVFALIIPTKSYNLMYFFTLAGLSVVIFKFVLNAYKNKQLQKNPGVYYLLFGWMGLLLSTTLSGNYMETYFNVFSLSLMSFLMFGFFVFFTMYFIEKIDENIRHIENRDFIIHTKDEKINRMALYDELTGIPNRSAFERDLDSISKPVYVGLFNIYGFMNYNKLLGFDRGDLILKDLANTLVYLNSENVSVYRYYSDKFLMIFPTDKHSFVVEMIENIYKKLESTTFHGITLQAYTGFSICDEMVKTQTTSEILTALEIASSIAKGTDEAYYEYALSDYEQHNKAMELEIRLKKAIIENCFEVHYQPQMDMHLDQVASYEALIRWQENGAYIPPGLFIPLAESKGLMTPITRIVIDQVFSDYTSQTLFKDKRVSINLSADQLVNFTFVDFVKERASHYSIDPKWIVFEITETSLFNDMDKVNQTLLSLKQLGYGLSLDDFGHGFSSLFRFSRLDIDEIKFDKAFIEDIENTKTFSTIQKTAELFKIYDMRIVVEGVETKSQLEAIQALDIDIVQGYYYAKPAPIEVLKLKRDM